MATGSAARSAATSDSGVSGLHHTPAVLLVGGMGTRLRSVIASTPKPLAAVGKKSFLELLVRQLQAQGILRLVMCSGYLGEQVESEFGDGSNLGLAIAYSRESTPLGTAGAVKLAQSQLQDVSEFLVMNGDSFLEINLQELLRFHGQHGGLVSMAVVKVDNAGRYGTVRLDAKQRVVEFVEKTGSDLSGMINAGVYVFDRAVLAHIPEGPGSLEKDVFPQLLGQDLYAFTVEGMFIDIGTPQDYARAQILCDRLYEAAVSRKQTEARGREAGSE